MVQVLESNTLPCLEVTKTIYYKWYTARTGGTSGWLRRKSPPSDPEIITRVTVKARWRNSSIFFLLIFILRWLTARGSHLACEKEEKKKRSLNVCVANTRWISFRQAALYERTKVIKDLSSRSSMGSSGRGVGFAERHIEWDGEVVLGDKLRTLLEWSFFCLLLLFLQGVKKGRVSFASKKNEVNSFPAGSRASSLSSPQVFFSE